MNILPIEEWPRAVAAEFLAALSGDTIAHGIARAAAIGFLLLVTAIFIPTTGKKRPSLEDHTR